MLKFFLFISLGILFSVAGFTQVKPQIMLTVGHNEQIEALAVSPNARFLASASNDKQLKIWDVSLGMEFTSISGMDGRPEEVVFSPDNQHIASTTSSGELLVWDVFTNRVIYKGTASSGRGMAFSTDGKLIYFVDEDSRIAVLDVFNRTKEVVYDTYSMNLVVDPIKRMAYSLDHLGSLFKINLENKSLVYTKQLFKEFNFPFSNSDLSMDGKFVAYGFNDDVIRILNTETGDFEYQSKSLDTKILSLAFDKKQTVLYFTLHSGEVVLFDYGTKKIIERKVINTSNGGVADISDMRAQCLTSHPLGDIVVIGNHNVITLYDYKKKSVFRQLKSRVSRIYNMAYDPTGRYLAVATDKLQLKIWDLELNRVTDSIQAFFPCQFTPDGKSIIAMTYQVQLGMFDVESGEQIKTFNTDYELIQSLAVSKDGTKLAGAGYLNKVKIWDLSTTKKVIEFDGHTGGILALDFHPTKPWLASGSLDQTTRIWDLNAKKEIKRFEDQTISIHDVKFSPSGNQLATAAWDKTIFLRNTSTWQTEHQLIGHVNIVNTVDYSSDGKFLVSGAGNSEVASSDNSLLAWDTGTGKSICKFSHHRGEVIKVICDPNTNRFYSASTDGIVNYSDYSTCDLVVSYLAIGSKEFMIYTPDSYYISSRNALSGIAFRIADKLVPFEQFDLQLNRPDIVARRIGKSSEDLIKAYYYLYQKRVKKLNLDEGQLKIDYKIPNLVNETPYDIVTTNGEQKFWIKAWDDNYALKRIDVFVNDVPIYGENGIVIPTDVKSYRTEITVPLIRENNKILITCMNVNGTESLYETIEIVRNSDEVKHDLYIAAIGVSTYKDTRFNLKYAAKDATDILAKFGESKNRYNAIHSKLLTNEEVTLENINALSEFFRNCTHEDMAILFIAGHGVLNVDFDYFFGTHDMDFDSPELRGLSYSKITSILNGIRAYQKLLVMDTCHSGELDREEIEVDTISVNGEGDVKFRGAGVGVREKEGLGAENVSKLTSYEFSSVMKGSGATVISSAGGAEYAIESDQWKNGLFTFVFLQGLSKVDQSDVTLSYIRSYVHTNVSELSNGKQIPSAREENISRDYVIFGN